MDDVTVVVGYIDALQEPNEEPASVESDGVQ